MEVIEDFALIVFELQKIFGREDLMNFLLERLLHRIALRGRKNNENYKPKRNN